MVRESAGTLIQRKTDWSIRRATRADAPDVAAYLHRYDPRNDLPHQLIYSWKYGSRASRDTYAFIATNSDEHVVAASMFMPWPLSMHGDDVPAVMWSELFVDLPYRGQAIADKTLVQALETTRAEGASVCLAFPNANSVSLHKRHGGIRLGRLARWTKPLDVEYLVRRKFGKSAATLVVSNVANLGLALVSRDTYASHDTVAPVHSFDDDFDALWLQFQQQSPVVIATKRDRAYMQWRYAECPDPVRRVFASRIDGVLCGFIVLESAADSGHIVDIVATTSEALAQLVAFAVITFRAEHKANVVYTALEGNMYFELFRQFGFVRRPCDEFVYAYFDEPRARDGRLQDASHWFVTFADRDYRL